MFLLVFDTAKCTYLPLFSSYKVVLVAFLVRNKPLSPILDNVCEMIMQKLPKSYTRFEQRTGCSKNCARENQVLSRVGAAVLYVYNGDPPRRLA